LLLGGLNANALESIANEFVFNVLGVLTHLFVTAN
jgi:hypothetical protein